MNGILYLYITVETGDKLRISSKSGDRDEIESSMIQDALVLCGDGFFVADDEERDMIAAAYEDRGLTLDANRPGMTDITLYLRVLDIEKEALALAASRIMGAFAQSGVAL